MRTNNMDSNIISINDSDVGYSTALGGCFSGDSLVLLQRIPDNSIDLVITSPPFSLQRQKSYGNESQEKYVDWLCEFANLVYKKIKNTGSFVIDIGGAYNRGEPTYNLYQFKTLIAFCDKIGFSLAEPFYWYNPSTLPSPIEWVNKRKLRAKAAVNTIWWLCKQPYCKADISKVLNPYSKRMEKLMSNPDKFVKEEGTVRPSGHVLGKSSWSKNNGGSIPSNLLEIPNSDSNSQYLRHCKSFGIDRHPARFPLGIPDFFIKFLTDEKDIVLDIFGGSNTTGFSAEQLNRKWLSFELSNEYVASSVFRFINDSTEAYEIYRRIKSNEFIAI